MQRSNGFAVPRQHWLGYRIKRPVSLLIIDEQGEAMLQPIPVGSNVEGLEPAHNDFGGGMLVRWKGNIVGFVGTRALLPLTPAAREFLKVCS